MHDNLSRLLPSFLFYISLLFILYYLFDNSFLFIPNFLNFEYFIISLVLIFLSNIMMSLSWQKILEGNKIEADFKNCYYSIGSFIFSKYIPGKIWSALGPASYISNKFNAKLSITTTSSVELQIYNIWLSLLVGLTGILLFYPHTFSQNSLLLFLSLFFLLSISIFSKGMRDIFRRILNFFIGGNFNFPNRIPSFSLLSFILILWLLRGSAFYFFGLSMLETFDFWFISLSFILAMAIGIIAFFSPGGLGVRESALVFLLYEFGLSFQDSVMLSIASRPWYMITEFIFFFSAIVLGRESN